MELSKIDTQSFIVKIWLEETVEEAGRATWRGHITHVPSNERRYLQDLDEIEAFITPYLKKMGVRVGPPEKRIPGETRDSK
jgi:hypothetical protein